jgi:hypothetical protein
MACDSCLFLRAILCLLSAGKVFFATENTENHGILLNTLSSTINLRFSFVSFVKIFVNFVVEFYHEEHKEYTKGTKGLSQKTTISLR